MIVWITREPGHKLVWDTYKDARTHYHYLKECYTYNNNRHKIWMYPWIMSQNRYKSIKEFQGY